MPVFESSFRVDAPLARVAEFHRSPAALRKLSPPPIFVQFHRLEPLAEGSLADFTLWFGPLPVRWRARHHSVDPLRGFTDRQESGPLAAWEHTHRFEWQSAGSTRVTDRVEYRHHPGRRGMLTRLLFARPFLAFLFRYRAWATRRAVRRA
jgi:ligand-binding SRPBCC domain-containing protein